MQAVRQLLILIALFSCVVTATLTANAADSSPFFPKKDRTKILLNADFIERDNEKDITILRDKVQIVSDQNFISCNEAVILWAKNEIVAVGNVLLKTQKSSIQADKIIFNMQDQKGRIFGGVITSGKVLMQAEYMEKIGPDTYVGDNTYFTACTTCPASWSFTAEHVEATIEGYAYLTNPWLNILEFPTLYSPYLVIPLKNQRQTGLLTPGFEVTSRSGTAIEIPYFWAIDRSSDATIGVKYYTKRGVQGLFNYRYRLSEKSGGELDTAFLHDQAYAGKGRWFGSYSHYLDLPNGYVQRTNLHLTSDLDYPQDFLTQFPYLGQPALDNRVSITKNFEHDYHLSIDASYYESLIQSSIDDSKESSVHRLPDVRFSVTDKKLLNDFPLFFRMDAEYVNFAREGLGYDSPFTRPGTTITGYQPANSTGTFNPTTDLVRSGQRIDVQPQFYTPFRVFDNTVDVTPFVGYRQTQYLLGAIDQSQDYNYSPQRNYPIFGVNTSTELSRVYESDGTKYRHSIIPELSFQSIPWFYQSNTPFFGTQDQIPYFMQTQPLQDLDLAPGGRGLQFDYEDRIVGRRLANIGLFNRVIKKNDAAFGSQYDQTFLLGVSQAYDFIEAEKPDGLPWQDIRGVMNIRWGKIDSFTEASRFPYHKVTNVDSRLRFYLIDTDYLELIYSNYLNVPLKPADVDKTPRLETLWVSAGMNTLYASLSGQMEFDMKKGDFLAWAANVELIPPGRCWTISSNFFHTYQGLDTSGWKVLVNFKFGNN